VSLVPEKSENRSPEEGETHQVRGARASREAPVLAGCVPRCARTPVARLPATALLHRRIWVPPAPPPPLGKPPQLGTRPRPGTTALACGTGPRPGWSPCAPGCREPARDRASPARSCAPDRAGGRHGPRGKGAAGPPGTTSPSPSPPRTRRWTGPEAPDFPGETPLRWWHLQSRALPKPGL
jgi:hypothetical protein